VENLSTGCLWPVDDFSAMNTADRRKKLRPFTNSRETTLQHPNDSLSTTIFDPRSEPKTVSFNALRNISPKLPQIFTITLLLLLLI
jgi:hypothetical protein